MTNKGEKKIPGGDLKTVLLVERDRMVSMLIKTALEKNGYVVKQCFRADAIKIDIENFLPSLIILDLGLPGADGFNICYQTRQSYLGPLIVLTDRDEEKDQITALTLGADDFLVKPVSSRLLKVRVQALLRRQPIQDNADAVNVFQVGDVELNPLSNRCEVQGKGIKLSTFEFKLLAFLLCNVGRVLTRDCIYSNLLGREYNGIERTVDVRISRLREKLTTKGMQNTIIETVWGKGYILNEKPIAMSSH